MYEKVLGMYRHVPVSYLNNEDAINRNGLSSSWYITDVTHVVQSKFLRTLLAKYKELDTAFTWCVIDYSQANVWLLLLQVVTHHDHERVLSENGAK